MKPAPPLVAAVAQCLDRLGLCRSGVVAVSGGPDSVALLRALVSLRGAQPAGPLVIAHLNHQLRGEESDGDEAFVQALHGQLAAGGAGHLELRCRRVDVGALARAAGANLEATGRRVRYAWLAEVAAEAGVPWVATGHTADDQAETVLHRLLRGAGLKGLRGIAVRRTLANGVEVVRPMLSVTRAEVLAYLAEAGQEYRSDRSNSDVRFTRNRLRLELLPHLAERYNPAMVAVLSRLAEQAEEAYQLEEREARALLAAAERPPAGALLILERQPLTEAPRHLVRAAFRLIWERAGWPMGEMSFAHWERLAAVACGEVAAVDLPGGIRARCGGRVVQVGSGLSSSFTDRE